MEHEQVTVRRGRRSGLPVIVAVHSTARGPALGGCRFWHYDDWRAGLADALRLSAAMTDKSAIAGLAFGGGKTVVALPPDARLGSAARRAALLDVGDAVDAVDGRYLVGPDVGTGPADMAVVAERTAHVLCRPTTDGGSGDSSPHTASGTLACLEVVRHRLPPSRGGVGHRVLVVGLGHVGTAIARGLADRGHTLVVTDVDSQRRTLATELGAVWVEPAEALTTEVDIVVPAALGGQLTAEIVPALRCAAVAGPANNQLADDAVADLLHERGILWAPDYLVSAGGIVHATAVEVEHRAPDEARRRVQGLGSILDALLVAAERERRSPHRTARDQLDALLGHRSPDTVLTVSR